MNWKNTETRGGAEAVAGVLVGLIGSGIGLSRTPAMHEAAARHLGRSLVYRLLDTDRMGPARPGLGQLLDQAAMFGFSGLNITHPYKQAVLPLLDDVAREADEIGSVNTVVFRGGRSTGHNTDYWGFRVSFQQRMTGVVRRRVLQLGAGGAGAAVARALLDCGVGELVLLDVEPDRADELVRRLAGRFGADRVRMAADVAGEAASADGIVNATPVGMDKLPGAPLPLDLLGSAHWAADIVYLPLETEFLRAARALGCQTLSGEGMAIH
ncbi:shikimate dehydrogenase [Minwuia thermotolerans]|uniref:Shikimate dehydrogenase n=1 Tax=Minwuia thermotolerans TaxID=2056226 RepID=A0A2M9G3D3_9PROT|nr:shikimate dehydrogenase [Minwuia thermotolerans]PJK30237.1 shikimate dehydrogenase [Minwuia thermotolerans]